MNVREMQAEFSRVRAGLHSPRVYDAKGQLDRLEEAALAAVYAENEIGGQARRVVAAVASVLGVDIDEGPGHRWDPDHMRRVVEVVRRIVVERDDAKEGSKALLQSLDEAREQRDAWKSAMEKLDERTARPLRRELAEERENSAALAAELRATQAALRREPARMVIHTTADEKRDWDSSDLVTADVLAKIGATAPVGSLVDDLKNTIVSQAREIARLKGESE
ncbi:hypothetical protein ACWGHD_18980 [Streptomyces xanthophaeus]